MINHQGVKRITPSRTLAYPFAENGRWRDLFAPGADRALIDAGNAGELLVARVRIWTLLAIVLVPAGAYAYAPRMRENLTALVAALVGLGASWLILQLARRNERIPGLAVATSVFDVSLVSATQFAFLLQGLPSVAANSRTTFLAYFIAIAATCLRWDPRICVTAGALAIVQYLAIAIGASHAWPLVTTTDVLSHGTFNWAQQIGRVIFLGAFTLVCTAIVQQSLQLRISSARDGLTGLSNRAFFEERLREELQRASRSGRAISVALVDVDNFKLVNDVHGHDAGDVALKAVARVLKAALRSSDLVARWGGEEFAIVLPETSQRDAFRRIDWLRATIAAHALTLPDGSLLQLTVSGGLAAYPDDGLSPRELFVAADIRLLEAKREGRDRIIARRDAPSGTRPLGVPLEDAG